MLVEGADALGGRLQRRHDAVADPLDGLVDLLVRHAQLGELDVVESAGEVAQGGIPAGANVVDDAADDLLGAEIRAERFFDTRPHRRWQRVRVHGHPPAAHEQRLAPRRRGRKPAYHARRHCAPEHSEFSTRR